MWKNFDLHYRVLLRDMFAHDCFGTFLSKRLGANIVRCYLCEKTYRFKITYVCQTCYFQQKVGWCIHENKTVRVVRYDEVREL